LKDFLLFKKLISIETLIFFYYVGAIVFPFFMFYMYKKNSKNFFWKKFIKLNNETPYAEKSKLFFVISLLFAELFWRLLFEFLISYIQVRDKVMELIVK